VATTTHEAVSARPPLWRDAAVLKWVSQIALLALVVGALWFLVSQAGDNLKARSIPTGFDFIEEPVGIFIGEGIDTDPATGGRALWVGMVNTLRIAGVGILVATILGVIVGLARLSHNWIVRKLASVFVETIRNIPLLVQIIFIFVVFGAASDVTFESGPINGWLHITNKGVSIPRVFGLDGSFQWVAFMVVGGVVAWFVHRQRVRRQDATGATTYPVLSAVGVLLLFGIVGWFAHPVMGFLGPVFGAIADLLDSIPEELLQIVLSALFVLAAAWWIRKFLSALSSGGGRAKLTDDDWFRIIFAGVGALVGVVVVLVVWPGLSSWMLNSGRDLFELLERRFGEGNGGRPFDAMRPNIEQRGNFANYGPAGWNMSAGFAAVFLGVTLYTASFIAEIVRGGILAVPRGQTEAASAVGLSRGQSLRHIILPQAFRIILPPLGNQYLNLTKNTSLAIAVGMSDVVQVGQTVYNQTGKTLPVVAIWMLFFLACSLTISVVVNFFNVRLKLVER
jgi:general L-amino acid transport system permease protein